jgi:phosphonate transport system substrate-binding protein
VAHRLAIVCMAGLIILFSVIASGCDSGDEPLRVRLDDRVSEDSLRADPNSRPLRIAVAPILAPKESLLLYLDLVRYLGERLERPAELVVRDTYAEVNYLLKERFIHAAFVCTYPYVVGHRSFGMEILAAPVPVEDRQTGAYLIVSKDSTFKSLADLRGRTFAFSDPLSNTGTLLPTWQLLELGENPETFFRETIFTYSHSNSIRSVAEGQVDAASVLGLVWEFSKDTRPELTERTRILTHWKMRGRPPVVVHPELDSEIKASLKAELLRLTEHDEGRKILETLGIARFVVPEDSEYDDVRKMAEVVNRAWSGERDR